jgi:hypothetical protein
MRNQRPGFGAGTPSAFSFRMTSLQIVCLSGLTKCLVDEWWKQIKKLPSLFLVISESKLSGNGLSAFEHLQEEMKGCPLTNNIGFEGRIHQQSVASSLAHHEHSRCSATINIHIPGRLAERKTQNPTTILRSTSLFWAWRSLKWPSFQI